jgi:hypothetical protein
VVQSTFTVHLQRSKLNSDRSTLQLYSMPRIRLICLSFLPRFPYSIFLSPCIYVYILSSFPLSHTCRPSCSPSIPHCYGSPDSSQRSLPALSLSLRAVPRESPGFSPKQRKQYFELNDQSVETYTHTVRTDAVMPCLRIHRVGECHKGGERDVRAAPPRVYIPQ